jgi:hypothetical protein
VNTEYADKVPGILLDEFDKHEAMRREGIVAATVSERDGGWFAVQIRFRGFGGRVPEVGAWPSIKEDEVTDDTLREMISEGLRVIWELYQEKAAEQ